jgi:hypothetical protein
VIPAKKSRAAPSKTTAAKRAPAKAPAKKPVASRGKATQSQLT